MELKDKINSNKVNKFVIGRIEIIEVTILMELYFLSWI